MNYLFIVIFILVIITLIFLLVYFRKIDNYEYIRKNKVNQTIEWLYQSINSICYKCNLSPVYKIKESNTLNYFNENIIYLIIWDEKYARVIDSNILIRILIEELCSIILKTNTNYKSKSNIQREMIKAAEDLGFYNNLKKL